MFPDPYSLLGVVPGVSPEQLQTAYAQSRANIFTQGNLSQNERDHLLAQLEQAFQQISQGVTTNSAEARMTSSSGGLAVLLSNASGTPLGAMTTYNAPRMCPNCNASNLSQAKICRNCGMQMIKPCSRCGFDLLITEQECSRCSTIQKEYQQERFIHSRQREQDIQQRRYQLETHTLQNDYHNRTAALARIIFWSIVLVICIGAVMLLIWMVSGS
jgi:ribosomal protein L40E